MRTKSTFLHFGTGPYLKFQLALAPVIRLPSHPSTAPLSHPKRCFEEAKSANLITHLSAPWRCLFFLQILELALSTAEKAQTLTQQHDPLVHVHCQQQVHSVNIYI